MKLSSIKVGTRLLAGFLAIAVLVAVTGAVGIFTMTRLMDTSLPAAEAKGKAAHGELVLAAAPGQGGAADAEDEEFERFSSLTGQRKGEE